MSKEGDFCTSCSAGVMRTTAGSRVKRKLERLGASTTKNKDMPVVACRHCDSPEIFRIAERNTRDKKQD